MAKNISLDVGLIMYMKSKELLLLMLKLLQVGCDYEAKRVKFYGREIERYINNEINKWKARYMQRKQTNRQTDKGINLQQ